MSSRFVSTALPLRTVTRSINIASTRCSRNPKVDHVNRSTTKLASLDDSMMETSTEVHSSPTIVQAKSLSQQIISSKPPSNSVPLPVDVFAKALEEDRKLDKMCETFVFDERQGKIARAWEPAEKELWLERFGGPGKAVEKVVGKGTVVLRDVGPDGKGYLRVLI